MDGDAPAAPALSADIFATFSQLRLVSLAALCEGPRFRELDRKEAYYRTTQDDHKRYTWEGTFRGYGDQADIRPGFYVLHSQRKPSARYDLGRVIVRRLTNFLLGADRFPDIKSQDEDTEDFARAFVRESRLRQKLVGVRNLGGAEGTGCMSFGLVNGAPRFEAHNAKHCTVLSWVDRTDFRVGSVLKAYLYPRRVLEGEKVVTRDFFYARYWDERTEIVWEPIRAEIARTPAWSLQPSRVITHGAGFCPFYWIPNIAGVDDNDEDGESDYEGQHDMLDEINRVLSASSSGTRASVDPTVVIRMDPQMNNGTLRKGHENAIYSPNGAEYLELRGTSQQAASRLLLDLKTSVLDATGVVLVDPKEIAAQAQSAAAMRIVYAPMLATLDALREQYGEYAIRRPVMDAIRYIRALGERGPSVRTEDDGTIVETRTVIDLSPKEDGTQRNPGKGEHLELNWPPYFPPTWVDTQAAVTAVQAANGGKPVITQKTGIAAVQTMFGITDVDAELEELEAKAEEDVQKQMDVLAAGPQGPTPPGTKPKPAAAAKPKPVIDDKAEET